MSTYVLVHGAWHGGWCWGQVKSQLEEAGHHVHTPDLPGHGEDATPTNDVTLQMYADKVCEVVNAADEKVILVGHSMGGIVISQAAEQCPDNIKKLVYLTAFLVKEGETLLQYAQTDAEAIALANLIMAEDGASATVREEAIKEVFYGDCDEDTAEWAQSKLVPQAAAPFGTPLQLTEESFGRLPRTYIECTQDRAISIGTQRNMQKNWPVESVITMETSHSPFLSQPEQLAQHLISL